MDEAKIQEIDFSDQLKKKNEEILEAIENGQDPQEVENKWNEKFYKNYKPVDFSSENSFELKYIKMSRVILMDLWRTGAKTLLDYMVIKDERNKRE